MRLNFLQRIVLVCFELGACKYKPCIGKFTVDHLKYENYRQLNTLIATVIATWKLEVDQHTVNSFANKSLKHQDSYDFWNQNSDKPCRISVTVFFGA